MNKPLHGGGVDRAMREFGLLREQIHDFSASINPLGPPPQVLKALTAAIKRISDYPELDAASLSRELARFHELPEGNLLPGSGSTELIYLLPRVFRPRRALLIQPCFSEYAPALQQAGCRIDTLGLEPGENFAFSVEQVLDAVQDETDLVLLANPGNPSGIGIEPQQLIALAERLGNCRLLIDEAFADFCPERSLLNLVPRLSNLLILRSLTKFYAIPGLRVGYLVGPLLDVTQLASAREPWAISNLAIVAAKACLTADVYRQQTLRQLPRLRADLRQGLEALGIKVFPGEANYLLGRLPEVFPDAEELATVLRREGLLIRNCADFVPLDKRFLRVAVLAENANLKLLERLRTIPG
ncbi:MAG: threonine-phosphate decarboxylase [Desulfuromonadales bacterium]|nr:threonine-phosphate decarboxylase [Desulfuromonadales bacterium]